ncbi:MAG TPA: chemotaxis protein CheA [Xanthobacteraceae bacterium]|nr:chemotaxis protein CheA [Xanthobacteraceae bacterium]
MTTIDDLRQTFFEESAEGLDAIDSGLSELTDSPESEETVNAVFRAIHSIKGGAGVFGFSSLVDFAHVFETVLDRLRHGKLSPAPHVVEVLQKANDTLSDLVAMAQSAEAPPDNFDADSRAALKQLIGGEDGEAEDAVAADFGDIDFQPVLAEDTTPPPQRFELAYRPAQPQFDDAYAAVVKALRAVGNVQLQGDVNGVPTLDLYDVKESYLRCAGAIESELGLDELRNIVNAIDSSENWSLTEPDGNAPPDPPLSSDPTPAAEGTPSAPPSAAPDPATAAKARGDASAKQSATTSIRVDLEKIDRVINMVGELVISQTMLGQLFENLGAGTDGRMAQVLEDVFLHTRELKNSVMSMRAQPVRSVFQRMSRLVRELSVKTDKRVRLETFGENTEVDKTVIERLSDPLTHIIRNAMDHGIESAERRRESGKPEEGKITLLADQRSSRIVIEVSDDGAGIDPERVIKKARDNGLIPQEGHLSEDEVNNLIFLPGFSTASGISEISGRGVGMDVVRRNVQELGGRISLKSTFGKGMTIQLALPLTLAVMDGMIVKVASETYVMPIASIVECVRPAASEFQSLLGTRGALRLRGAIVPIVYLSELFELGAASEVTDESTVIIIETSEGVRLGIVVDQLIGHQQVVIKSIEENYGAVPGIAGATILGDGHVAFILDAERLGEFAKYSEHPAARKEQQFLQ